MAKKIKMDNNILKDIRVLDFTRVLAGPFATRILADFGAEVIKVQSASTATGAESNDGGYFNYWNRNKKSITLNLNNIEAIDIILQLAEVSDVIIENFSSRVMTNFGLNFKKLKEVNPDIIMASMTGFGQTGPWKDYVAFGPTVQSFGGLNYLTSYDDSSPVGMGFSYADPVVGLYGAFAVLAALEHRDNTGEGQYIDISGYEAVCASIGPSLMEAYANTGDVFPHGNSPGHTKAAPYGCFRCDGDDKWCVIAVYDDNEWEALKKVVHVKGLSDKRFLSSQLRSENLDELHAVIEAWTLEHTCEEVEQILQMAGIHAHAVQNAKDLAGDPHLQAAGFFISLGHPVLGKTISDTTPLKPDKKSISSWKSAPLLGEDNDYVYMDLLGFSEEKMKDYVERGIIG